MTKADVDKLREIAYKVKGENLKRFEEAHKQKTSESENQRKLKVDKLVDPMLKKIAEDAPKGVTVFRFAVPKDDFEYAHNRYAQVRSFSVMADAIASLKGLGLEVRTTYDRHEDRSYFDPEVTYSYFLEVAL